MFTDTSDGDTGGEPATPAPHPPISDMPIYAALELVARATDARGRPRRSTSRGQRTGAVGPWLVGHIKARRGRTIHGGQGREGAVVGCLAGPGGAALHHARRRVLLVRLPRPLVAASHPGLNQMAAQQMTHHVGLIRDDTLDLHLNCRRTWFSRCRERPNGQKEFELLHFGAKLACAILINYPIFEDRSILNSFCKDKIKSAVTSLHDSIVVIPCKLFSRPRLPQALRLEPGRVYHQQVYPHSHLLSIPR